MPAVNSKTAVSTEVRSAKKGPPIQEVILERDGVHFVNANMFKPDRKTEAGLDRNFRELVDSVTSSRSAG